VVGETFVDLDCGWSIGLRAHSKLHLLILYQIPFLLFLYVGVDFLVDFVDLNFGGYEFLLKFLLLLLL
jgi:hypothetical protein